MRTCSNCGFDLTTTQPVPTRCPRCGAALSETSGTPPPLPSFERGPTTPTLFGLPEIDDSVIAELEKRLDQPPGEVELDTSGVEVLAFDLPFLEDERPSETSTSELSLDLPMPSRRGSDLELPGMPGGDSLEALDPLRKSSLGEPRDHRAASGGRGDPGSLLGDPFDAFDELDLPAPTELTPSAGLDLPAPLSSTSSAGLSGLDLPTPIDLDLPEPKPITPRPDDFLLPSDSPPWVDDTEAMELEPMDMGLEPVDLRVQPKHTDLEPTFQQVEPKHLELEPTAQQLEPKHTELEPKQNRSSALPSRPGASVRDEHAAHRRPPPVQAAPRAGISKAALYGGIGGLVLAVGLGIYSSGLLDDQSEREPGVAMQRSGDASPSPLGATGVAERPDAVLAALRRDTPRGYRDAIELGRSTKDPLSLAEALLSLHLRYGPYPKGIDAAKTALKPFLADSHPFVRRVMALQALAAGKPDVAKERLASVEKDGRDGVVVAWAQLQRGAFEDARATAQAVLDGDPDDVAALVALREAEIALDPAAAKTGLQADITTHPEHPRLLELLGLAHEEVGELRVAREALARITTSDDDAPGYRARVLIERADVAIAQGDDGAALKRLGEALAIHPKDERALDRRARVLIRRGQLREAGDTIEAAIKAHPKDTQLKLTRVDVLIAGGEGDRALAVLDKLSSALKGDPRLAVQRGRVLAMRMQVEDGAQAFMSALERDPGLATAWIEYAKLLEVARKPEEALAKLDEAWAAVDKHAKPKIAVEQARLWVAQGDLTKAAEILDRAVELVPFSNEAQAARGRVRVLQNDEAGGRADLMAVLDRAGAFPGMTGPLGRILAQEGDTETLERLVGDRANDANADAETKLVAARFHILKDDPATAQRLAESVLALNPEQWEAKLLVADALRQSGAYSEALEQLTSVQPPTPQAEVYLLRGKLLEFNGRYADARPEYQRALAIEPNLHEARFLYGRSLAYAGAGKAAIDELNKVVLATGDRYPGAYAALGRAQRDLGNYDQALRDLRRAVVLDPNLYAAWYQQGTIYAFRNQHRAAAEALEHAVQVDAKDADWYLDAWMRLGRAQYHAGERGKARASLQRFVELAPAEHPSLEEANRLLGEL